MPSRLELYIPSSVLCESSFDVLSRNSERTISSSKPLNPLIPTCVWVFMNPGRITLPVASISLSCGGSSLPIYVILLPSTSMLACRISLLSFSVIIVPFLIRILIGDNFNIINNPLLRINITF